MANQIFVNLPVKDLKKSVNFFSALGFTFNQKFTNENATCMILGENMFSMLLVEKFFSGFLAGKSIANASKEKEVLVALSLDSREAVDAMMEKAIALGGKEFREKQDHGWMYLRALEDLDGHVWELGFMDESKFPGATQ